MGIRAPTGRLAPYRYFFNGPLKGVLPDRAAAGSIDWLPFPRQSVSEAASTQNPLNRTFRSGRANLSVRENCVDRRKQVRVEGGSA